MIPDPDPRDLIGEAYRMPDLGASECRSIFLDWVLGHPQDADVAALARTMLARHEGRPDHPMTAVLESATGSAGSARRRGGRGRISEEARRPPLRER